MLKKTITYTDYNGNERTEDNYFNLTEAELYEMELSTEGGLAEQIQTIINAKSAPEIVKVFKTLVLKAYGVRTPDGRGFEKSDELRAKFANSIAYSEIFMELALDADAAAEFVNNVMPKESKAVAKFKALPNT